MSTSHTNNADLLKSLGQQMDDLSEKIDNYEEEFNGHFTDVLWNPNVDYKTTVTGSAGFFLDSVRNLLKAETTEQERGEYLKRLEIAYPEFKEFVALYRNAPEVKEADKKLCDSIFEKMDSLYGTCKKPPSNDKESGIQSRPNNH